MSLLSYVGRKVDLLALQPGTLHREGTLLRTTLAQELLVPATGQGQVVTGSLKLAQRWLLRWLCSKSSFLYRPLHGSSFLPRLRRGQLRSAVDVRSAFATAALEVAQQLRKLETPEDPLDEQLGPVSLQEVELTGDHLILHIELQSLAGSVRQIVLPIALVPPS